MLPPSTEVVSGTKGQNHNMIIKIYMCCINIQEMPDFLFSERTLQRKITPGGYAAT